MNALRYLIDTIFSVFTALFLLRFFLQWARADFYNPISQAIVRITNPLVLPLRRVIPGLGGLDVASLVAALLIQMVALAVMKYLAGASPDWLMLLPAAAIALGLFILQGLIFLIFISVIVSWFRPDPRNPVVSLLYSLTEPVLRPARRIIPPMGGLDLSPMIVLIVLYVLLIFLTADLPGLLR